MDSHKFIINIKQLSESQDINDIAEEWEFYKQVVLPEKTGRCICNHTVKKINKYVNKLNGKIIDVGEVCSKKYIELEDKEKVRMKYVKEILGNIKVFGEYKNITDVLEFENEIRTAIMEKILKDITNANTIISLNSILEDVKCLSDIIQGINEMSMFLKDSIKKIKDKKECILEEERLNREKERIQEEERKRINKQNNLYLKMERERLKEEAGKIEKDKKYNYDKSLIMYEIKRVEDTIERLRCVDSNRIENGIILSVEEQMKFDKNLKIWIDALEGYKQQLM